jgi:hypothetical protein
MVKVDISGDAGAEVIIRYGESTYEDGRILMPDPLFKQFETGVYAKFTLGESSGLQTWEPDFSFTCARYIQVDGVALEPGQGLPVIHSVVGQHVSSASRKLGSMGTDKEDVNALIKACYWSYASNLFSYHTDCPQIEKFGWLEVTHLLALSILEMWRHSTLRFFKIFWIRRSQVVLFPQWRQKFAICVDRCMIPSHGAAHYASYPRSFIVIMALLRLYHGYISQPFGIWNIFEARNEGEA